MPPPQAVNFKTVITSTAYSWGLIVPPLRAQVEMSSQSCMLLLFGDGGDEGMPHPRPRAEFVTV